MADGEKVITGLSHCKNHDGKDCPDCPYFNTECIDDLSADALDLIKELLKEQKVKTGYWIDSAGNDKCSICGEEYSDLYPDYGNTHFCPNCGAKMDRR